MKAPAELVGWLCEEEFLAWLRESRNVEEYKKRVVLWLVHFRRWPAKDIAEMTGVSVQSVWLWVSQFNKKGIDALDRKGRGGRRWGFMTLEEEKNLLGLFEEEARNGRILTAKNILSRISKKIGHKVSLWYVYGLLRRHGWRKIGPRPHHVKADLNLQEEFKKNFRKS